MLRQVDPDYVSKLNSVGILFFSARDQLDEEFPLKVYRIDHTWGTIWDHAHDYVQIWYVNKGAFDHSIDPSLQGGCRELVRHSSLYRTPRRHAAR